MNHEEFVNKYSLNQIHVNINKNKAGFMFQDPFLLPRKVRLKQANLRALVFGGMLVGFIMFFFTPIWLALSTFAIFMFLTTRVQQHAADAVLEESLKNPHVYHTAIMQEVLEIEEV